MWSFYNTGMFTVDNDYSMIDDNVVDHIRGIVDFNSCVEYTESYVRFSQTSMRTVISWIAMNALIARNWHAT